MALNNQATGLLVGHQRAMVGMTATRGNGYGTMEGQRTRFTSCLLEPQERHPGCARSDGRHSAGDSGVMQGPGLNQVGMGWTLL